jgi:hypothetical protein
MFWQSVEVYLTISQNLDQFYFSKTIIHANKTTNSKYTSGYFIEYIYLVQVYGPGHKKC